MQHSQFVRACAEEWGEDYSRVLLRDHWLVSLGGTAADALARGVPVREVWLALCEELDVPVERRHGRGLRDSRRG